jgi:hypothetical protein
MTRGRLASGSVIPRPEILKQRRKPRPAEAGPKDTAIGAVREETHTIGDLPTALKKMLEAEAVNGNAGAATALPKFIHRRGGALFQAPGAYRSFASSCF